MCYRSQYYIHIQYICRNDFKSIIEYMYIIHRYIIDILYILSNSILLTNFKHIRILFSLNNFYIMYYDSKHFASVQFSKKITLITFLKSVSLCFSYDSKKIWQYIIICPTCLGKIAFYFLILSICHTFRKEMARN